MARRHRVTRRGAGRSVGHGVSRGAAVPTTGAAGTVIASVSRGFYVEMGAETGGEIVAVLDGGVHPGPMHLLVAGTVPAPAEGTRVEVDSGIWSTAGGTIDARSAVAFAPPPPAPQRWAGCATALATLRWGDEPPPDLPFEPAATIGWLRGAELERLAAGLGGRGGGFTPTGDDVAAGVLLAARHAGHDRGALLAAASAAPTTTISGAFLRWAARGHGIAPVHDLLVAAGTEDRSGLERAAREVAAVGSSSGTALLHGLVLAARHLPGPSAVEGPQHPAVRSGLAPQAGGESGE